MFWLFKKRKDLSSEPAKCPRCFGFGLCVVPNCIGDNRRPVNRTEAELYRRVLKSSIPMSEKWDSRYVPCYICGSIIYPDKTEGINRFGQLITQ